LHSPSTIALGSNNGDRQRQSAPEAKMSRVPEPTFREEQ